MIELNCKECEYMSSDSCRDTVWFLCTHPNSIIDEDDDGSEIYRTVPSNWYKETPNWCPLKKLT